ncbi:MAG TPA: PH domain-containing protein [Candidatus Saccharimonadales bacterium]|nr:PH domain-containing protein [Candidatus Saccharimonadales bacterium]
MVTLAAVEEQLKAVGCTIRFWGRPELRELSQILLPGEQIAQAVNGQYEAGWALLVATDMRVLLIDKKPKYLTLKDVRYDMITELDFSGRMMNSTIRIYTPNKELRFTTFSAVRLRKLFTYTQHKIIELRHHSMMQQFSHMPGMAAAHPSVAMMQQFNQQLGANYANPAAAEADMSHSLDANGSVKAADFDGGFYTSADPIYKENKQQRVFAAMGNAGLRSIVHNGQIIREYMSVPFAQRWKRRPYGFSRESTQAQQQVQPQ